ncbi:cell division protein ZipA C-terminal FtsZ-binding domain-containing protein [Candidatus Fukatsuia anoeciicola]|uniref:cell division protein ZipA C-terminal FtsZ-binding domain-containing protein n=1 Tax=Candidatus Fukatsuia anoeciicola TaxID=2994492 RepID=UPI003463CBF6
MHQAGLYFNKINIFHYYFNSASNYTILFNLINIVKLRFFDLVNITNFTISSISLLIVIPSCGDAYQNFKFML